MTTTNNDRKKKQIIRLKREKYNIWHPTFNTNYNRYYICIYTYMNSIYVYVYIMKKVSVYIFPNPYHLYECVCMINV